MTLGAEGALLVADGATFPFLYPPVKTVLVDTTGAGDTFNGVLVAVLAEGYELSDVICFAQNVASLSARKSCVMPSLPDMKEIEANFVKIIPQKVI